MSPAPTISRPETQHSTPRAAKAKRPYVRKDQRSKPEKGLTFTPGVTARELVGDSDPRTWVFAALPLWVFQLRMSGGAERLYAYLLCHRGKPDKDTGEYVCFPGQDLIAWDLRLTERQVVDLLQELVERGLLIKRPHTRGRQRRHNEYVFTPGTLREPGGKSATVREMPNHQRERMNPTSHVEPSRMNPTSHVTHAGKESAEDDLAGVRNSLPPSNQRVNSSSHVEPSRVNSTSHVRVNSTSHVYIENKTKAEEDQWDLKKTSPERPSNAGGASPKTSSVGFGGAQPPSSVGAPSTPSSLERWRDAAEPSCTCYRGFGKHFPECAVATWQRRRALAERVLSAGSG